METRCADCGMLGEITGHMDCQYPGAYADMIDWQDQQNYYSRPSYGD
jgi:hypothetical protein